MSTTTDLDLTPFGFTPTETSAYRALVQLGPSSGYAVAKTLGIARANAYQALDGLASKGAAALTQEDPRIYRAVDPAALLAQASTHQAALLEALERQLRALGGGGQTTSVRFSGARELDALILRTAAMHTGPVRAVAPPEVLTGSIPVWRKRAADGLPTELWPVGTAPSGFPLALQPPLDPHRAAESFGGMPVVVVTSDAAIVGRDSGDGPTGFWSSEAVQLGLARAAIAGLVRH